MPKFIIIAVYGGVIWEIGAFAVGELANGGAAVNYDVVGGPVIAVKVNCGVRTCTQVIVSV